MKDSAIARAIWTTAGARSSPTYLAPPNAGTELVIAIRDGEPSMFVLGPRGSASWKRTQGLRATATLQLRPGVVQSAFGVSPRELRDAAIPARELLPSSVVARTLEIAATRSPAEAALSFLDAARAKPSARARLAEVALRTGSAPHELARTLGVSARTLRRLLGEELGVTPRELMRFARIARLLSLIVTGRELADIALACGYADQAHMSNDARQLLGRSPSALARDAAHATIGGCEPLLG